MTTSDTQQVTVQFAQPQAEHRRLEKFVGEWTFEGDADPNDPSQKSRGRETVRSMDGLWIVAEGRDEGAGPSATMLTLGYDPQRGRYIGSWVGSMMTHLWVYEGEVDAAGRAITLIWVGPSMAGDGMMAKYRDLHEFESDDHRVLKAYMQGADGSWQQFMTTHYRRVK
jgi:hypothetical protein